MIFKAARQKGRIKGSNTIHKNEIKQCKERIKNTNIKKTKRNSTIYNFLIAEI